MPVMEAVSVDTIVPVRVDWFSDVYAAWFHRVERWIHALGGPSADVEDVAQEVFLIVQRRLPAFDGQNLAAWLYRITARKVRDHRRLAWFRQILSGRDERELDALHSADDDPETRLAQQQQQQTLYRVLDRLSEKRRTVFILFELEGSTGPEIAEMLGIPVETVFTRLHHARKDFKARIAALRAKERLP